jgi:cytoskeletal protein RodZ
MFDQLQKIVAYLIRWVLPAQEAPIVGRRGYGIIEPGTVHSHPAQHTIQEIKSMSQLGERFRQAREAQGISLAQAATETRIRQQLLSALEDGRYDLLPNDVVSKGFVRNYAQLLGLPADEMVDLYRLERGASGPIQVKPVANTPQTRSYGLPGFFAVFFVTIALVGLTYVTLSASGVIQGQGTGVADLNAPTTLAVATPTQLNAPTAENSPTTAATDAVAAAATEPPADETATPTVAVAGVQQPPAETIPTPTATRTPPAEAAAATISPTPQPGPSATPEAPIVVEVATLPGPGEGSWLRVRTDNVVVYEQIMAPGQRQVFTAQRQVNIRAGNPTFVQVSVNGLPPETLGQVPGEPVDWSWPPQ